MRKMRTIEALASEYRNQDSGTAVTKFFIRQAVISGRFKGFLRSGNKYLIDAEKFDLFLNQDEPEGEPAAVESYGKIRKIN